MQSFVVEVYEDPSSGLDLAAAGVANPWVVWAALVVIWASALYYAWLCRNQGGYPAISWAWSGFRVACNR